MPKGHDSQAKPTPGQAEVMPHLRAEFDSLAGERYRVGLERYGTSLQTFNGRDAGLDCMEEMFDAMIYLKQLRMENDKLKEYVGFLQSCIRSGENWNGTLQDFILMRS
jgi:hypothetical protein